MAKTYDSALWDIAISFLSDNGLDTDENCVETAALLQSTLDDQIEHLKHKKALAEMVGAS